MVHLPLSVEISIVPRGSTGKERDPHLADVTRQPSGTRTRKKICLGELRVGRSRLATTSSLFSLDVIVNETGPKQVSARVTLMTLPSSSHRLGVAKHRRSVSGAPSSSMSQS